MNKIIEPTWINELSKTSIHYLFQYRYRKLKFQSLSANAATSKFLTTIQTVQLKTPYTVYTVCINLPKNIIGIITLESLCKILCCCNPQVVDYIHPLFLFSPRLHTAPWTLLKLPVKIPQIIPLKMFMHPMSFKLKVSWSWSLIQLGKKNTLQSCITWTSIYITKKLALYVQHDRTLQVQQDYHSWQALTQSIFSWCPFRHIWIKLLKQSKICREKNVHISLVPKSSDGKLTWSENAWLRSQKQSYLFLSQNSLLWIMCVQKCQVWQSFQNSQMGVTLASR